ncbi:hypothetical protein LTS10_005100 [Elasticomyces elasticus]|nr:hypothetical protein LTS10_005100 [Elasticomyces elasticus]
MHTPALLAFVGTASAAAHIGSSSRFRNGWMPYEPAEISTYLNSTILTTPSTAEFTYPGTGLDGPKVHPVNGTNFDWWYFDAVSDDLAEGDLSSVIIVFYTLSQTAFFGQRLNDSVLAVSIAGTLRDGTPNYINLQPGEATITTLGDSSAGQWGSGPNNASWSSSPDLRTWVVTFNNEIVNGSLTMTSIAPPHLPCGLPTPFATELIIPHVGWVNAIPDALTSVDFTINGSSLQFSGAGYHDKNWGDQPLFDVEEYWYWGHGRLGPYSIVWFDAGSLVDGEEHFSAYVARNGRMISGSCVAGESVVARPWGNETVVPLHPPTNGSAPAEGFEIIFAEVEGKEMRVNVTNVVSLTPLGAPIARWTGTMEGGFEGERVWTGVALYEEILG